MKMKSPARTKLIVAAVVTLAPFVVAQSSAPPPDQSQKTWTSTYTQQSPSGNVNPTRSRESHSENNGKTVDKQSVERVGMDGRYEPYQDIETETVKVDASTSRTIQRTYGRGPDGQKTLIQVTQQETRSLPGGVQKVVRTTSNPDANGRLEVIRRETQDSKPISPNVRETKTTVLTPDSDGRLSPSIQTQERETRNGNQVTVRTSTSLADLNGNWQVSEVKESVAKGEAGKGQTKEERVLRPGSDGNLAVIQKTITKDSASPSGESRSTVETFSNDVPGMLSNGLQMVQRSTTVRKPGPGGVQTTVEKVEQPSPGNPSDGLRVTGGAIDIVRPGSGGVTQHTQTILSVGSNGSLGTVLVDTGKTDKQPPVKVDTKPADSKPADAKPAAKPK